MPTTKVKYSQITLNAPQGYLLNGKIVPSVASNNLTVAIKTLAGNDPSPADPVTVRIGDTVRSITAALAVTRNAGSNWLNSGCAELATKEIDYFVYLGYNTTDGVVIAFSRLPYCTEYGEFTYVDQTSPYSLCASNVANATTGDDYELVGRFTAINSGSASYNWSVPAFTNRNLIQRPVFETRALDFVPALTGFSGTPTVGFKYLFMNRQIWYTLDINGTSNATTFTFTIPFTLGGYYLTGWLTDNGSFQTLPALLEPTGTRTVNVYKTGSTGTFTNALGKRIIARFIDLV